MPSSRSVRLAVALLVILAGVVATFAFVDANALRGETAVNSWIGTARVSDATASLSDPVTIYVPGNGWLETAVADRIEEDLSARGADVERADTLDGPTETPVLVVAVAEREVSYLPISPGATVSTSFAYVQSGNSTLARSMVQDESPTVSGNVDAYVVGGDVTVSDRARGLATWPAYQRRVATATAEAILEALEDAPGMDQPN
ncbi:MAG: hypothetical protein ABEJ44_02390 [Halanaeroarchaeum sp.]